jgi:hypothetical protein
MITDFVSDDEAEQLTQFLSTCSFKSERSHAIVSFGTPYNYNGAKAATDVPPIPDALTPLFTKVNDLQAELFHAKYPDRSKRKDQPSPPNINSCLINKYEGPESYLPKHSDKEVTINPESSVFTLSLGESCTIKFSENSSGTESSHVCVDRSMYHMTRRSQEVYSHSIEKGSISEVRYSFTLLFGRVTLTGLHLSSEAFPIQVASNVSFLLISPEKFSIFSSVSSESSSASPKTTKFSDL